MPERPKRWGEEGYPYQNGESIPGNPNNPYPGPFGDWTTYTPAVADDNPVQIFQRFNIILPQLIAWWDYAAGVEQEAADMTAQRDALTGQLADCRAAYAELEEQAANTSALLAASESAYAAQAADLAAVRAERDALAAQLADCQAAADAQASALAAVQAQLDATAADRDAIAGDRAALQASYDVQGGELNATAAALAACEAAKSMCDCPGGGG